jgi:hypothetical protein
MAKRRGRPWNLNSRFRCFTFSRLIRVKGWVGNMSLDLLFYFQAEIHTTVYENPEFQPQDQCVYNFFLSNLPGLDQSEYTERVQPVEFSK